MSFNPVKMSPWKLNSLEFFWINIKLTPIPWVSCPNLGLSFFRQTLSFLKTHKKRACNKQKLVTTIELGPLLITPTGRSSKQTQDGGYVDPDQHVTSTTVIMIYNGSMYTGQGSNFGENKGQLWRPRAEIWKLTDDHFSTKSRFCLVIKKLWKGS